MVLLTSIITRRSFQQVAIQNHCVALSDLRHALKSEPPDVGTNLAMSLIFCSLESIMADNGAAWYQHLVGAAGMISANISTAAIEEQSAADLLKPFEDAHSGRWLLRNFAYRDIVMAVSRDQSPLLRSHHFLRLDEPRLPDSHFGLASEILEMISRIAVLNEDIKAIIGATAPTGLDVYTGNISGRDNVHNATERSEILTKLLSLESQLTQWSCPPSTDISLRLLAECYRSSALIHLYRTQRKALPLQANDISSKANSQAAVIVDVIDKLPTRSLPECTLLFPIFLAGGEVTDESHIKIIRHRMLDMIESRGFRNVEVALSVLEKLWRLRITRQSAGSTVQVDWLDIVRQEGIELSLS